jgi:hypothetical protein
MRVFSLASAKFRIFWLVNKDDQPTATGCTYTLNLMAHIALTAISDRPSRAGTRIAPTSAKLCSLRLTSKSCRRCARAPSSYIAAASEFGRHAARQGARRLRRVLPDNDDRGSAAADVDLLVDGGDRPVCPRAPPLLHAQLLCSGHHPAGIDRIHRAGVRVRSARRLADRQLRVAPPRRPPRHRLFTVVRLPGHLPLGKDNTPILHRSPCPCRVFLVHRLCPRCSLPLERTQRVQCTKVCHLSACIDNQLGQPVQVLARPLVLVYTRSRHCPSRLVRFLPCCNIPSTSRDKSRAHCGPSRRRRLFRIVHHSIEHPARCS